MTMIYLVFLTFVALAGGENCQHTRNRLGKIEANYNWIWTIKEVGQGKLIPVLNLSWNVDTDIEYDGWFYRIENMIPDTDQYEYDYDDYDYDEYYDDESLGYDEINCTRLLNESWRHEALTKEEINVTCHTVCFERRSCAYNNYCMRIQEERYQLLSKKRTSLELELAFGVEYDFRSYAAYNYVLSDIIGNEVMEPIFCIDYYVRNEMAEKEAREKCKGTISDFHYGPVYNFTVDHTFNLTDDTVTATISWKRPFDIKPGVENITKYGICDVYNGKVKEVIQASDTEPDHLYRYSITRKQGEKFYMSILPNDDKCKYGRDRSKYFARYTVSFPVINSCNTSLTPSYCVDEAYCDNKYEGEDKCDCYSGYDGNGVDAYWGGTGCKVTCATRYVTNHTCHEKADCVDTSNGVNCSCPAGFIGDGYRNSTGCTIIKAVVTTSHSVKMPADNCGVNIGLIIAVVILLVIILAITTCVIVRRRKRRKQRKRNKNSGHLTSDLEEANNPVKKESLQLIITSLEMQNLTKPTDTDCLNFTCPIKAV